MALIRHRRPGRESCIMTRDSNTLIDTTLLIEPRSPNHTLAFLTAFFSVLTAYSLGYIGTVDFFITYM